MTRWSHVEDRVLESELGGIGSVLVFLYFTPSLQAAAIFFFGCLSQRTDLDWLWSQQSSCQGTCLGVRRGKDHCRIGITGAGTLVGRQLGWPRTMCESCRVTSERMAGARSLSVRIQLQPTETTLAGFNLE